MAIAKETVKAHVEERFAIYDNEEKQRNEVRKIAIERINGPTLSSSDFTKKIRAYISSLKPTK